MTEPTDAANKLGKLNSKIPRSRVPDNRPRSPCQVGTLNSRGRACGVDGTYDKTDLYRKPRKPISAPSTPPAAHR